MKTKANICKSDENDLKERQQKEQRILNYIRRYASPRHPYCWCYPKCVTLTLVIEIADPASGPIKSMIGHASMAVGQKFMDFGPIGKRAKSIIYTDGGAYWSDPKNRHWKGKAPAKEIKLNNVRENISLLVDHNAAVEIATCICKKEGDRITRYWDRMLISDPSYSLLAKQCASSISANLHLKTTGYHFLTPETLLKKFITENRTDCKGLPIQPPYAKLLKKFG